ncbi:MAG: hypothetical protein JL50_04370 [Peptococcaceae bacterium BICA1-7]|nr:MAG: hypothetical protein JL50_04370 [Peptococcaceae bacterium BICA1-7]HBV95857.1 Ger(x)C family spore germination protein [Desulfotomaculum sp.]
MRNKLACLALLVMIAGVLGGCWSRKEMSELAIVLGAGVDSAPGGQVRLTLQLARTSAFMAGGDGGGGKEPSTWVISDTGETIADVQRKLSAKISRHIYWAHDVILVFGEEAARGGIRKYTNFFSRELQPRETMWVMVARGEAKDILETGSELERTSAQDIGFLARARTGFSVIFKDFIIMLASKGGNPIATMVEIVDRGVISGDIAKDKPTKRKGVALTGTAVFDDDKLVGWLNMTETRGLLWLKGEVLKGVITFPSLTEPGRELSVNIIRGQTEVEPQYDGESVRFYVNIEVEGDLIEQQSVHESVLEEHERNGMEKEMAREIEGKARLALDKAQGEYGLDIFDFGEAFRRKYPREWEKLKDRWNEVFSGAGVEFAVDSHIRRSGLQGRRTSVPE